MINVLIQKPIFLFVCFWQINNIRDQNFLLRIKDLLSNFRVYFLNIFNIKYNYGENDRISDSYGNNKGQSKLTVCTYYTCGVVKY